MKVVSARAMTDLEAKAYQQGSSERDFMENAGKGIADAAQRFIQERGLSSKIWLLCGKGNNGGDAFVAGRRLIERGFQVKAIQPESLKNCSPLCKENGERFLAKGGGIIHQTDSFGTQGIILDGLFGTGFKGAVRPPYSNLIEAANKSGLPILAIDIPSGLNGTTGLVEGSVIQATETLFLGLPKTGFFLQDGWNAAGYLQAVDFGLPQDIIEQASPAFELMTQEKAASLLPPVMRSRHKYQAGFVVGLAGSPSMPGAALLSSLAAFRGGSGMVKLLHVAGMEAQLAVSPYELIKIPYDPKNIEEIASLMNQAGAVFIGPGLGRGEETQKILQRLLPTIEKPAVLDADALFFFAANPFRIPQKTIFTPHMGEMQTLLDTQIRLVRNQELIDRCQRYAEEHAITLVLKGAPTFIFHPGSPPYVNPTGDPGMATAGSGDVLTGLLASLLSQGLDPHHAALLGVYLHGLAGEFAAYEKGSSYGMMASDLIAHFDSAFHSLTS